VLKRETRTAILELAARGVGKRAIARTLGISRRSLHKVLASGLAEPPALLRPHKAAAHREQILALHASCRGNLVRVREELLAQGVDISYQALTAFCRHCGIGTVPKIAAGHYHFDPGQEMQHDTSPHKATIGGRKCSVHSAAAVLAYSGMLFFQAYPRFRRFECKVLLTEACRYFGGAPAQIMIDNTHVVVLRGTGAAMVPVPEMVAFAERFGLLFRAHEKGDANRSARVERPFHFIEHNFFAGRAFTDLEDLNTQARQWCDQVNQRYVRSRRARPSELFAVERTAPMSWPAGASTSMATSPSTPIAIRSPKTGSASSSRSAPPSHSSPSITPGEAPSCTAACSGPKAATSPCPSTVERAPGDPPRPTARWHR
jgi:transposase